MTAVLQQAFEIEMRHAAARRQAGDLIGAFGHLQRAHILGQRQTRLHIRAHAAMLVIGWQRRDLREMGGQLVRVIAAALFSRVWVPEGNTGGADVSALKRMPLPPDLALLLHRNHDENLP